ncbi:acyltransferase family protein [Micrococcoides hystricis]|uniref:Acyltransferase family protein n=1 Tax=Micrococcoides hystricis TaxID=1572761 RepID=A0ABV6PC82_9MICC
MSVAPARRKRRSLSFDFLQRGLPPRHFRPELHGVRGLAILGVVLFHLFGDGRVSGGIDIFLAISGFLFTAMLLREAATSKGSINLSKYFARLIRRIIIPAVIVVAATLALGLWVKPETDHHQLWAEARASALYFENVELINSQLAYGAAGPETSPFQHYWSLSVQGQFYLLWPLVAVIAVLVARYLRRSASSVMAVAVGAIFIASLVYALYYGSFNQDEAYLMTRTRMWELAFGGLLALLGARLTLPEWLRVPAGWLGLALIVSCGFVIDGAQEFPGLLAFWPLGGLALVLAAAGPQGGLADPRGSATRFLSNPVFGWIGDRAYGLYLWHWPLLIFYMEFRQREAVGLAGAAVVLATTVLLAELMYRLIERPIAQRKVLTIDWRVLAAGATVMLLIGIGMSAAVESTVPEPDPVAFDPDIWDWDTYPGAQAALAGNSEMDGTETFLPDPATLNTFEPQYYTKGCRQSARNAPGTDEIVVCEDENMPESPRRTVVIAGGSHAGQWEAVWLRLGQEHNWEVLIVDKSGCVFADYSGDPNKSSCQGWLDHFMDWL